MSQLEVIQKSQLVLALDAKPFAQLEDWEQTDLVAGLIKKVALYTMYAVDPAVVLFLAGSIRTEAAQLNLTDEMLKQAVQLGMTGQLGEFFGIASGKTWGDWMRAYKAKMDAEFRAERISRFKAAEAEKAAATEREQAELMSDPDKAWGMQTSYVLSLYELFANKAELIDGAGIGFKFLERCGCINLTIEEKSKMFESAQKSIILDLKQKAKSSPRLERIDIAANVARLEANDPLIGYHIEAVLLSRYRALKSFFAKTPDFSIGYLEACKEVWLKSGKIWF